MKYTRYNFILENTLIFSVEGRSCCNDASDIKIIKNQFPLALLFAQEKRHQHWKEFRWLKCYKSIYLLVSVEKYWYHHWYIGEAYLIFLKCVLYLLFLVILLHSSTFQTLHSDLTYYFIPYCHFYFGYDPVYNRCCFFFYINKYMLIIIITTYIRIE